MRKTVAAMCAGMVLGTFQAWAKTPAPLPSETGKAPIMEMDKAALRELDSIKNSVMQVEEAWNKKDVKALLSHFTEKASVMDHEGNQASGKAQIESWASQHFDGLYKNARTQFRVDHVRMLTANLAMVELNLSASGLTTVEGNLLPPQEIHATVVGQKKMNKWYIQDMRSYQFQTPAFPGVGGVQPTPAPVIPSLPQPQLQPGDVPAP